MSNTICGITYECTTVHGLLYVNNNDKALPVRCVPYECTDATHHISTLICNSVTLEFALLGLCLNKLTGGTLLVDPDS